MAGSPDAGQIIAVTPDHAPATDESHQVLPFRRRGAAAGAGARRSSPPTPDLESPDSFAKYEGGAVEDNYRHRMIVNVAGFAFTVVLATAGVWLAVTIADMRKNQDCYLSGRRNCTPIDTQSPPSR
jgi:hypothetical protein